MFLTEQLHSTKTERTLSILHTTRKTLVFLQSGIFFATSHGKGPCDGVGGTVKRLAARASLQRPYRDQLQTPLQLYQWAKENIPSVTFVYVPQAEYEEESKMIEMRLSTSKTIEGTQKLHSFLTVPGSKTKLMAKVLQ